jgi:hypothetical protein
MKKDKTIPAKEKGFNMLPEEVQKQISPRLADKFNMGGAAMHGADGGRVGYFFGGRVNYKSGGRVSFKNGGLAGLL